MKKRANSPKKSREDKRITRMHQMEMMEAAARGTQPSYTLDTSILDSLDKPQQEQQKQQGHQEQEYEPPLELPTGPYDRNALVASDFLGSTTIPSSLPSRTTSTSTSTGFFSQREKYEVDQSINHMDASSKRYSVSDYETGRGGRGSSFVDIFIGGSGRTSGSTTKKGGVTTTWTKSTFGRILIVFAFLAFMALLTLSVPFLMTKDVDSTTGGNEASQNKHNVRTRAPASQETTGSSSGSGGAVTLASVDYDNKIEDGNSFEDLKAVLLEQGATSAAHLEDESSSAFHALRWLTDDDPKQVKPNDPVLPTRFALATLYYATHPSTHTSTGRQVLGVSAEVSSRWTKEDHWMTEANVCDWYGVDCETSGDDSKEQAVIHLNLTSNAMQGTIPLELKSLTNIVLLDLSSNGLSGTLPPQLSSLAQVKYFLLQRNSLTGTIPESLDKMGAADEIYLSRNQLTGTVPRSLGNISNLRTLDLGYNKLSGGIPDLSGLKDINHLHLNDNSFDGSLPTTLKKLTMLDDLRLENNKLTGRLPEELAANERLRLLYLGNNHLDGRIPEIFKSLNKLTDLQLHGNRLKSHLPTSMGSLTSLRRLTLEGNVMTGRLPTEWGRMTDLEALELYQNEIVGAIPSEFGEMTSLRDLGLGHNFLQGEIPSELGKLTRLKGLGLQRTALKGAVPSELGNLKALETFELAETMVTGTIPDKICDLTTDQYNLQVLEADCRSEIECSCCSTCF